MSRCLFVRLHVTVSFISSLVLYKEGKSCRFVMAWVDCAFKENEVNVQSQALNVTLRAAVFIYLVTPRAVTIVSFEQAC